MKEKMFYDRTKPDNSIVERLIRTSILTKKLNSLTLSEMEQKIGIITELFASVGENLFIGDNFHCDFGKNIYVGNNFHADYNCTMLDVAEIRIGNNCLIGPDVGIYTAGHRLSPSDRTKDGYGSAIEIGDDVWIGGHSVILPGVTIGNGAVIAAGSVVTRDVMAMTLVAGNSAKYKKDVV